MFNSSNETLIIAWNEVDSANCAFDADLIHSKTEYDQDGYTWKEKQEYRH